MTTDTQPVGYAEIPFDPHERRTRSADGTIIAIHHQGTRLLLLLDSDEQSPLTVAEARRIIEQTRKNVVGWHARWDGTTLTLARQVPA